MIATVVFLAVLAILIAGYAIYQSFCASYDRVTAVSRHAVLGSIDGGNYVGRRDR